METNKECIDLFDTTKTIKSKNKILFILKNENDIGKLYKDILLKKESEISIILNIEGSLAKYIQTLKLGICCINER